MKRNKPKEIKARKTKGFIGVPKRGAHPDKTKYNRKNNPKDHEE